MRHYLTLWLLLYIFCSVFFSGCVFNNSNQNADGGEKRPNVILILTDDQGWGDLGIHGNDRISTPSIDAMAGNGAHFEQFYVSPLCAPTRASLLTGRYNLRTGTSWVSKGLENMNPGEVTIAEIFQQQGYATGCFGKWHNGAHFPQHPNQQGFDEFIGFCAGHWNNYFSTILEHNGQPYPTNGYISDVLTDEAIKFIEKNKDREFFCYVPFNAPHGPFQVPDPYFDKYKTLGFSDKDAAVYGMCENIDENVGRIRKRVAELRILDNTIIIFMTDNGPNGQRYNGGMRGIKGSIHEGGVRVPCLINWEEKISSKSIPEIVGHIDILPTLVSLCNLDPPETLPLDGLDISSLLLEENNELPKRLFYTKKSTESIIPDGAVRSDQYRLVIEHGDTMLFDMKADPGQKYNISSREIETTAALVLAYNNWFQEVTTDFEPATEIRLGFEEEMSAYLPAHEAGFSGEIHFMEGHGWAHDWLVNWVSASDSIYWDVVVEQDSKFKVDLLYSCPEDHVGSIISVSAADKREEASLSIPHDPEYLPSPDRIQRIEVYEKEWARLELGSLTIPQGNQRIVLKAETIPNGEVGEIKGLKLSKFIP
jgi:arylsulfatase A